MATVGSGRTHFLAKTTRRTVVEAIDAMTLQNVLRTQVVG